MTDLEIDDGSTEGAVATLRAAAAQLEPVIRAAQELNVRPAEANAAAGEPDQADRSLATALDNLGKGLAGLADWMESAAAGQAEQPPG